MIELKKYTIHEMSAILNSKGKQAIERKLKGYDIEFITSGRGDDVVFEITAIQNKFKVFCITEFNMPAQCGFERYVPITSEEQKHRHHSLPNTFWQKCV